MSYQYETQYNSPNFTPASQAVATWGRPRTIEAIAIHWWGDPNQNPSYAGVISTLVNPARGASAHFVATGTGRKVACLVDLENASWATNSANPYTISIECDPRCRNEDYDVVAELIAQIRQVYGDLPLVPHRQFVATACPGNYDLGRLDREARNKVARPEDDWGTVGNKVTTPPTPPAPTKPNWIPMDNPRTMITKVALKVRDLVGNKDVGDTLKAGTPISFKTKADWQGKLYVRSEYSTAKGLNQGVLVDNLTEVPVIEPPVTTPEKPVTPTEPTVSEPENGFTSADRTLLQDIKVLLEQLLAFVKGIFK